MSERTRHLPALARTFLLGSLLLGTFLLGTVLAGALPAQKYGWSTVTAPGDGEVVATMRPFQRALARGGDDRWYVLVRRHLAAAPLRADLELWRSAGGARWELAAATPTAGDGHGALVADPGGDRLHVLWDAGDGRAWHSVWYQLYDLATGDWVGQPARLQRGTDANDQYFANDLAWSAGALVAAVGSHRSPRTAGFSGWATALQVLRPGADDWTPPAQVNTGTYGVWGDLAVQGPLVHLSFRTHIDRTRVGARSYDVARGAFVQARSVAAAPPASEQLENANPCLTGVDLAGNRYVLYVVGGRETGAGRLCVAFAAAGTEAWRSLDLAADPDLRGGNYNPQHLALARGPGNLMLVFYARSSEGCAVLYQRVLDAGETLGGERVVARDRPGAFAQLVGLDQELSRVGVQLVVGASTTGGDDQSRAANAVRVYGLLRPDGK